MFRGFSLALTTLVITLGATVFLSAQRVHAQGAIEMPSDQDETPVKKSNSKVGRKAAQKYMGKKGEEPGHKKTDDDSRDADTANGGPNAHYLAVHLGSFVSDNSYKGNAQDGSNIGRFNLGVTYRLGEWVNSADFAIRVDYLTYAYNAYPGHDGRAKKLSFMPVLMFPDASSHFPLYFGAGAGLGVFLNQVQDGNPSILSLDYSIFAGVRFFDVIERTGFFLEAGLKNHILLLSEGQFNGTFVAAGAVFNF
jgi:hypothetical protein